MSQKKQILTKAEELFFRLGVKSITMDDLSRELGISKKTLYLFVDNKADLVNKTLIRHFEKEKKDTISLTEASQNAIDEIIRIAEHSLRRFRSMHPSSIYDIKKYYPKAWDIIEQYKMEFIYKHIKENLARGKREKLYRENINEDIISRIYLQIIDFIVNPHNFPATDYNFIDLYKEFISYHLQGIVTAAGYEYLKDIQLKDNE